MVVLGNSTSGSKLTGRQTILVVHRSQPELHPVIEQTQYLAVLLPFWLLKIYEKLSLSISKGLPLVVLESLTKGSDGSDILLQDQTNTQSGFSRQKVAYFLQILRIFICQKLRIFLNFVHDSKCKLAHEKIIGSVTIIGNVTL